MTGTLSYKEVREKYPITKHKKLCIEYTSIIHEYKNLRRELSEYKRLVNELTDVIDGGDYVIKC